MFRVTQKQNQAKAAIIIQAILTGWGFSRSFTPPLPFPPSSSFTVLFFFYSFSSYKDEFLSVQIGGKEMKKNPNPFKLIRDSIAKSAYFLIICLTTKIYSPYWLVLIWLFIILKDIWKGKTDENFHFWSKLKITCEEKLAILILLFCGD